jgi:hypothetical protein
MRKTSGKRDHGAARAGTHAPGVREQHAAFAADLTEHGAAEAPVGRFEAVMEAAGRAGLLEDKDSRVAARVSSALVEQAKRRTGIESDSDLVAFALASIAVEDDFIEVFKAVRGKIDPTLKLGY